MSALDTFYTLFKSMGADEVIKKEKEVKEQSDKLEKSFKKTDKTSLQVKDTFQKLTQELVRLATAGLTIGSIIGGIKSSLNYAVDLDTASRALNVNVSELDAWGYAVQRNGGNLQSFESSLQSLAEHLGTTGDVAIQVLPQLADSFQKMGRYGALLYGKRLGMDEGTILLLQRGRREVESIIARQKELGVVTKQDAELARRFNFEWQDATHSLRNALLQVALDFLPGIIKRLEEFGKASHYFSQHSDVIAGGLTAIGLAAAFAFRKLALGTATIAALTTAIGVLYEDVKAFSEGKSSFIGDMDKKFPLLKDLDDLAFRYHILPEFLNPDRKDPRYESNDNSILQKSLTDLRGYLDAANASAINYKNDFYSSQNDKRFNINIGDVYLQTQATDVDSIAQSFTRSLSEQLRQTISNFDDGIAG